MNTDTYSKNFSTNYLQTRALEQQNLKQSRLVSLNTTPLTKRYYNINSINNSIPTGNDKKNLTTSILNENCLQSKTLPSTGSAFSTPGSSTNQNNTQKQNGQTIIKVNYCKPPSTMENFNNSNEIGKNTDKILNNETESLFYEKFKNYF